MRKRQSLSVPVQVYNLGSPAGTQMDFTRNELWSRMNAEMGRKAVQIPVFLVNPDQIDAIYPPKYRRALDPEWVRRLLREEDDRRARRERRERHEEEPDFFDRLERGEEGFSGWVRYEIVVATGLYLRMQNCDNQLRNSVLGLGDSSVRTKEAENAFLHHSAPAIFLCGERIVDQANRLGVSHHLVTDKVYYHELGHAVMDTLPDGAKDPYETDWGRTVEESLANAIAHRCFKSKEALWVQRLIQNQPAEYLGYAAAGQRLVVDEDVYQSVRYLIHELGYFDWDDRGIRKFWRDVSYLIMRWEDLVDDLLTTLVAQVVNRELLRLNIDLWKRLKRYDSSRLDNAPWKQFAEYLLREGVS